MQGGEVVLTLKDQSVLVTILKEMKVNFKKPKNKKSFRKKQKLDVDALEAEAVSAGLGAADLGSRNGAHRQGVREEKERLEAERRDNIYKVSYAKADEASKSLQLLEQKVLSVKADQEYNEFNQENRLLETNDEKEEKASGGPEAIAFLATTSTGRSQIQNADDDRNRIPSSSEDQSGEKKVVITERMSFWWVSSLIKVNPTWILKAKMFPICKKMIMLKKLW
ncbi:unnamed protein product [Malus baccata var. baccata]